MQFFNSIPIRANARAGCAANGNVCAYGVFYGTHTGEGSPCPPTGKRMQTDYVYVMEFDGDKIRYMTKIWHAELAMQALGWV